MTISTETPMQAYGEFFSIKKKRKKKPVVNNASFKKH
jgi:hypothetical protein